MRILFFMMSGNRTGSEVGLFNYICHADRRKVKMAVACPVEGELLRELPPDVPVFVHRPEENWRLSRRVLRKLSSSRAFEMDNPALGASRRFGPDVWYINTIIQPELVRLAARLGIPCVLHSHELEQVLWTLKESEARDIIEVPRLVIAGSRTAEGVLRTLGRGENIEVCYETIDREKIKFDPERSRALRRRLGIGERSFVWLMSGSLDPNKNPVLFAELARDLLDRGHDAHFLWLGGTENGYSLYARNRAAALRLSERLVFVGARADDYFDYFGAGDGLALTSAKESFSIVTVEAAYLGKPVVAFNCGGVSEIVREGMGVVIDSWNRRDLAAAMERVMSGELPHDPAVARERAEGFDISARVGHWERTLAEHLTPARLTPCTSGRQS